MIRPSGEKIYKAMRLVAETDAWQYVREWLESAIAENRASIRATVEGNALNRLEGERETILTILEEFDSAPMNEAAAANGPPVHGLGGEGF